ncbi:type IV secretory system conjugative DNA transfer family protein [Ochrobactrum pecoris]|nr:type IV secretory system conjugative DNA transfer family protein [Brucella pecoris]
MTIAPTRTGKGVGTIIPNLAHHQPIPDLHRPERRECQNRRSRPPTIRAGPCSRSLRRRRTIGCVNPLDRFDLSGLDFAEDASTLADAMVNDEPGMSGEAHWNE